jgi:type IV secretion system protein VirB11
VSKAGERTLRLLIEPMAAWLADPHTTDVIINEPGHVLVERRIDGGSAWAAHLVPEFDLDRLEAIATLAAAMTRQDVSDSRPLCATIFPDGERVQIVRSPAVDPGYLSLTIRRPSAWAPTIEGLASSGLFGAAEFAGKREDPAEAELLQLHGRKQWAAFFSAAVAHRKNIILCGATGSGKTTLAKALIGAIPLHERVLTIEDTPELVVPHRNRTHLFYSKGDQGLSRVTAGDLLEACLRMRPDRVLLQELRDGSAFTYLRGVASGHPGSITTLHAESPYGAFDVMTLMVKQHEAGRHLSDADIHRLIFQLVDVVAHCDRSNGRFRITEVYYDPARKRAADVTAMDRNLARIAAE